MLLRHPTTHALAVGLYVVPTGAFLSVAAATYSAAGATMAAAAAAGAFGASIFRRLRMAGLTPAASRSGPALDALAWGAALAACPILCFVIHAFGGVGLRTAFALSLLSYPLNLIQMDDALDRLGLVRAETDMDRGPIRR